MPYKSKKQEIFLRLNKPDVAKKFDKDIKKKAKKTAIYKQTDSKPNPYKNKALFKIVQRKAKKLGITVEPSKLKNKKIDIYKNGVKLFSVGDSRYKDYHLYLKTEGLEKANMRKKLYKIRHSRYRNKKGTKSYYADQLLWT